MGPEENGTNLDSDERCEADSDSPGGALGKSQGDETSTEEDEIEETHRNGAGAALTGCENT